MSSLPNNWLILLALAFALAPSWIPYSVDMWGSGHYQYFPVLLGVVAYLLYNRRDQIVIMATEPSPWIVNAGFVGVAMLAFFAHLLYSGFLGIVATVLAIWVVIYAQYGAGGLKAAATVLLLLFFAIPLPLSLDDLLVVKLQSWASRIAAQLLDGLGIMHFRQGVILVTEKSQFMTEEACSGIRSLFSSLAFVSVFSVMQHHHWVRTVGNLLQTVIWVIICNAVRIAAVVVLADHVSTWFASGAGHEMLGMAIFLYIMLMVISTDALIGVLIFRPLMRPTESLDVPPSRPTALERSEAGSPSASPQPRQNAFSGLNLVKVAALGCIGALGLWVAVVQTGILDRGMTALAMPDLPPPAEDDLPAVMGNGWQRVKFERIQRDTQQLFGEESYVYQYAKNGRVFVVSVDLPWTEWHNLNVCYTSMGWESKPAYFVPRPQAGEGASQTELDMTRLEKSGFVIFAVVDRNKKELSADWRMAIQGWQGAISGLMQQAAASLGFGRDTQMSMAGKFLPATTIQLFAESSQPFTQQELEECRELYDEIRRRLLAGQRWR